VLKHLGLVWIRETPNGPLKINRHYRNMTIPSDMAGVFGSRAVSCQYRHFDSGNTTSEQPQSHQATSGIGNLSFIVSN